MKHLLIGSYQIELKQGVSSTMCITAYYYSFLPHHDFVVLSDKGFNHPSVHYVAHRPFSVIPFVLRCLINHGSLIPLEDTSFENTTTE